MLKIACAAAVCQGKVCGGAITKCVSGAATRYLGTTAPGFCIDSGCLAVIPVTYAAHFARSPLGRDHPGRATLRLRTSLVVNMNFHYRADLAAEARNGTMGAPQGRLRTARSWPK
jgi:hypothetical protein